MKQFIANIYSCVLHKLCVVMLLGIGITPLYAQISIHSTGVEPVDAQVLLDGLFPNDYRSVIFTADGQPIMDNLYFMFGLEGVSMGIIFTRVGDAYVMNGLPTEIFFFDQQTLTLSNVNGKKLYFTGTCVNAFAGVAGETEGFIYIKGAKGEKVDIYIDDLKIKTQSKRLPGQSINQWLKGYISGNASPIAIGSMSDDTTQPFTVNFHIRGENRLVGGATSKLEDTGNSINNILADILYLSAAPIAIRPDITLVSLYDTIPVKRDTTIYYSRLARKDTIVVKMPAHVTIDDNAPISINHNTIVVDNNTLIVDNNKALTGWNTVKIEWNDTILEEKKDEVVMTGLERYRNIATKLTFDDVWPTSTNGSSTMRTNGLLDLPVEGDLGAPSIDLGNSKGQVEFNGGQYKFHTPRTNSMFYVSSMAICYRQMTLAGFTTIGVGSSMSAGTSSEEVGTSAVRDVVINDGTFSTYPAEKVAVLPDDPTPVDVVGKGWYVDYTDLRLPYNARIYGGTFTNCNVYRCDGSGEQGVPPLYVNPLNPSDEKTQCRTQIQVTAKDAQGVATAFADEDAAKIPSGYGTASLTPITEDGKDYVYIYTTIGCNPEPPVYTRNWVTLIPKMGIEGFLTMGGNQTVYNKTLDGKSLTNKYLFYARLNDYTKQYAAISLAGFSIEVYQAIDMIVNATNNPELEFAHVTNEGAYTIEQGLYTMLSFPSNEWQLISLPYDVHRVWVMETTKDQLGQNDSIGPNETLDNFLIRQGKADGKLAQNIVTSLCPDIFSGKGSGVNMNLIDIATEQIDCPPFELTHYDGSNASQAHYYLYEQVCPDPENIGYQSLDYGWGTWQMANDINDYSANWTPVVPSAPATTYYDEKGNARTDAKVLMKAGGIYNLFLPSGKDRYWDGKYLIFEGYGPQQILGSDNHSGYLRVNGNEMDGSAIYEGEFSFQGNRTFANFAIDPRADKDGNIFVPVRTIEADGYHYTFKPHAGTDSIWIHPGEVYGVTLESGITSVSMRGVIARKSSIATGTTPVVGDVLLYAYAHAGGLVLEARAAQYVQVVSIDGRVIYAGEMHDGERKQIAATTGVYVVRSEEQAIKLLVP